MKDLTLEAKLLKIILETMFLVLLNMDFSPSVKSVLRTKKSEYEELLLKEKFN